MTGAEIRTYQRSEVRRFIAEQEYGACRVLDYGCGDCPYREIIESNGGHWTGYNRAGYPGGPQTDIGPEGPLDESWDVIVCSQMLQYVPDPARLLERFGDALAITAGRLVLTYATNWPEVEREDLYRFTRAGMVEMLAGWAIEQHRALGELPFGDVETIAFGYGVIARP